MKIELDKDEIKSIIREEIHDCVSYRVYDLLGYKSINNGGYIISGIPFEAQEVIKDAVKELVDLEVHELVKGIVSEITPESLASFIAKEFKYRLENMSEKD